MQIQYGITLLAVIFFTSLQVVQMGEKRNAYRILVGKPEGKRPLGRLRAVLHER
jgi:hypothetical protein